MKMARGSNYRPTRRMRLIRNNDRPEKLLANYERVKNKSFSTRPERTGRSLQSSQKFTFKCLIRRTFEGILVKNSHFTGSFQANNRAETMSRIKGVKLYLIIEIVDWGMKKSNGKENWDNEMIDISMTIISRLCRKREVA
jgi:hypothetical protein